MVRADAGRIRVMSSTGMKINVDRCPPIPESALGMDRAQTLPFLPATPGDSWADKHPDLGLTNVSISDETDRVEVFKSSALKGQGMLSSVLVN